MRKISKLTFTHVNDLCDRNDLESPNIQACVDGDSEFTITRVQMYADFQADKLRGAYVISREHDSKCLDLLAKSKDSDVVLFPEYCFSYDCIEQIVTKKQYWPLPYKLWCLPCQGIEREAFYKKLDQFKGDGAVVLRDGVESLRRHGNFVNALLYCFVTVDLPYRVGEGAPKLVLLPQMKTHRMGDQKGECETYMTRGETIFVFGEKGGNYLISLLCADVLNPALTWDELKVHGKNLILLHPQLNPKPTHSDFQKLRLDMFQGTDRHVYISANWAKGSLGVDNPWSCVYSKHERDNKFAKWHADHVDLLEDNPRHLLYGGFYEQMRVSIWYAWTSELAQEMMIQKPYCSMAVMHRSHDVIALKCLRWESGKGWIELPEGIEREYRRLHYVECLGSDPGTYDQLLDRVCKNPAQYYPFIIASKAEADRFWELVQAKEDYAHIQLDQSEIPRSPVILFADRNMDDLKAALGNMRDLGNILEGGELPRHLDAFHDGYCFALSSRNDRLFNITTTDGAAQIILAIAEDDSKANRFIRSQKKGTLKDYSEKDSEFPYLICVFAKETLSGELRSYPEFDPDIIAPERERSRGNIAEGGRE